MRATRRTLQSPTSRDTVRVFTRQLLRLPLHVPVAKKRADHYMHICCEHPTLDQLAWAVSSATLAEVVENGNMPLGIMNISAQAPTSAIRNRKRFEVELVRVCHITTYDQKSRTFGLTMLRRTCSVFEACVKATVTGLDCMFVLASTVW